MLSKFVRRGVWLGILLLPMQLLAIILDPLSLESLTRQADLIVQGTVLSKTCLRDASGRIFTRIELQMAEVWKGAISGSPFTIVQGGGILGEEQTLVSGQVEYEIGEEVVAFLVRNDRGQGVTLGLRQGKFNVWKDAITGTKYASNPFHGAASQRSGAALGVQSASRGSPAPARLALEDLKKRVLQEARR